MDQERSAEGNHFLVFTCINRDDQSDSNLGLPYFVGDICDCCLAFADFPTISYGQLFVEQFVNVTELTGALRTEQVEVGAL